MKSQFVIIKVSSNYVIQMRAIVNNFVITSFAQSITLKEEVKLMITQTLNVHNAIR